MEIKTQEQLHQEILNLKRYAVQLVALAEKTFNTDTTDGYKPVFENAIYNLENHEYLNDLMDIKDSSIHNASYKIKIWANEQLKSLDIPMFIDLERFETPVIYNELITYHAENLNNQDGFGRGFFVLLDVDKFNQYQVKSNIQNTHDSVSYMDAMIGVVELYRFDPKDEDGHTFKSMNYLNSLNELYYPLKQYQYNYQTEHQENLELQNGNRLCSKL